MGCITSTTIARRVSAEKRRKIVSLIFIIDHFDSAEACLSRETLAIENILSFL